MNERLTEKVDLCKGLPSYCEPPHIEEYSTKNKRKAVNKLGKLEDIEDDIGCSLDLLFKAMKQGLFYREYLNGPIKKFIPDGLQFIAPDLPNESLLLLSTNVYENCMVIEKILALNGYGTEWALTREELEK